jgi:hypothetical protein
MYSLSQLRTVFNDPRWLLREALRTCNHVTSRNSFYSDGIDIFERDWDVLILLDACRFDEFERACTLDGHLSKVMSRGSTSSEFVRGNFTNRALHDTVYISANGHFLWLKDEINASVHRFIGLHKGKYRNAAGGLTTCPETVTEHAFQARKRYSNKRLIIHYLQPHQPYLGPFGKEFISHKGGLISTVQANNLSQKELMKAYRENLEIVLDEVEYITNNFDGKIVVTADHGEMLGERLPVFPIRDFGHFEGVYNEELLAVPWFTTCNGDRPEILSEEPDRQGNEYNSSEVESHLEALGYQV